MQTKMIFIVFILISSVLLSGCNTGPDLAPKNPNPELGRNGFCRLTDDGENLIVTIVNIKDKGASDSSLTVDFHILDQDVPVQTSIGELPGNSSGDVQVEIPSGCFSADCSFTIEVDSEEQVNESNENNNQAKGICIG